MIIGYYVRAIRGTDAHAEWSPLVGPFQRPRTAHLMLMPVERACQRHGRYKDCRFGIWRGKAGPGKLPLSLLAVADVIEASKPMELT